MISSSRRARVYALVDRSGAERKSWGRLGGWAAAAARARGLCGSTAPSAGRFPTGGKTERPEVGKGSLLAGGKSGSGGTRAGRRKGGHAPAPCGAAKPPVAARVFADSKLVG